MHDGELDIDASQVTRLVAAQFPYWADLPLVPVASAGTDHAMFRLGSDMVVRLPRIGWAVAQIEKEHRWLPLLAPLLPLAIPVPLALGQPADGYPWKWSVYRWLDGHDATVEPPARSVGAAIELAAFVSALQRIDPVGGPPPGDHNVHRGEPLASRDAAVREAIDALGDRADVGAVTSAWDSALAAPTWQLPPRWIHGDLAPGNLLVRDGRLSAVIDFGCLGVGDPACDLMVAWTMLSAETRKVFRDHLCRNDLHVDDASWARGRGWALSMALIALPYYWSTSPVIVASATRVIEEVLADHARVR